MERFERTLYEAWNLYLEDGLPPPPEEPAAEAPAGDDPPPAAPAAPVDDDIDESPDDMSKLKLDMVESIRKALVINPNDIDRSLYGKLTHVTTLKNLDEMEKVVQELVTNYYPDTGL